MGCVVKAISFDCYVPSHIMRIGVIGSTSDFESERASSSLAFAATGAVCFLFISPFF